MDYHTEPLRLSPEVTKLQFKNDGKYLTYHQTLTLWATNPSFRKSYWQSLIAHGGNGCLWEHPRLTPFSADKPYECVITRTENFSRFTATSGPFLTKMELGTRVSTFPNLGGDSLLIVPNEPDENTDVNCRDLIAFCRTAPEEWLHEFWKRTGTEALKALADNSPRQFLSTHGFGVLWLHVRLEERAKYYNHQAYRVPTFG